MKYSWGKKVCVALGAVAVVLGTGIMTGCKSPIDVPPIPDPVEKITNGQFTNDLTGWQGGITEPATGEAKVVDGAYKATITNQGTENWHVQLWQTVAFISGMTYTLSFDAYSPDGDRTLNCQCQQNGGDYHPISGWTDKVVTLSTTKQTLSFTFSCTESNDAGRLNFDMGKMGLNAVIIDNVSMMEQ
jgi:hypothetical protein